MITERDILIIHQITEKYKNILQDYKDIIEPTLLDVTNYLDELSLNDDELITEDMRNKLNKLIAIHQAEVLNILEKIVDENDKLFINDFKFHLLNPNPQNHIYSQSIH